MIALHKPSSNSIAAFLAAQSKLPFTYADVGATARVSPSGYNVDHNRIKLGEGERAFLAARAALESWTQFQLGWVEARWIDSPLRAGGMVAVVGKAVGLWWVNACRIIYVIDELGPIARFGFAYGTLPAHAGMGEERFLIEWNRSDNSVYYDLLAFSKPRGFLAHLGYRRLRTLQQRFGKESGVAMAKAIKG